MEVSGQLHTSVALSPGKHPPMRIEPEAGQATEQIRPLQKTEKSVAAAGSPTPTPRRQGAG
jgi:hypothetical protein